ncbi:MAG: bifunctional diaminohydroxyphosphoribosylaminopyrimidine deaminase/5-amino-6-(5-phosphoribosylamino)uracil reductase RibD [Gemmataceae bacterium]
MTDAGWMTRALELASRGRGGVEPNPLVGAVVVRDGVSVGEGWHERFGGPHAEVLALAAAGAAAQGATLYVTLEPCCHHGKTPPCTEAILAVKPARVVVAMRDPFPRVAGQGIEQLRAAGIVVEVGVEEQEASRLNAPYLMLLGQARPWVIAKWAMTLDGRIATRTGDSRWISNEPSRRVTHQMRARVDAILVGIGTALADDPRLDARPAGPRKALRVILDSQARLPANSYLAQTALQLPTLVVTTPEAPVERRARLTELGCEVLPLEAVEGRPSLSRLMEELGRRRCTNLLVEGGGEVLGAFRDANLIDEVHVFVAPTVMGGTEARSAVLGLGPDSIAGLLRFDEVRVETIESDVHVSGRRFAFSPDLPR